MTVPLMPSFPIRCLQLDACQFLFFPATHASNESTHVLYWAHHELSYFHGSPYETWFPKVYEGLAPQDRTQTTIAPDGAMAFSHSDKKVYYFDRKSLRVYYMTPSTDATIYSYSYAAPTSDRVRDISHQIQ